MEGKKTFQEEERAGLKDTEMEKGKAFMNDETDIGPEAVWEG